VTITVAIMQPYFIPYAGYFRLFAASDLFIIYDCVQFPRRGWVHRNKLLDAAGNLEWLTLPLVPAPRNVLIGDLQFPQGAAAEFGRRLRRFPLVQTQQAAEPVLTALRDIRGTPVDYIEQMLSSIATYLSLPWATLRSSQLAIPVSFRGQDRIFEIIRRIGAHDYVNAAGGRALYDAHSFADAGIGLNFLIDYPGPTSSILTRILREDREALIADIKQSAVAVPAM
jgi:WbqC-like protein family